MRKSPELPNFVLTMRTAFVSDIHGNLPALLAVVADMQSRKVDRVVNLGDSLSGPLMPGETARYLMAQDWVHLAGNHERYVLGLKDQAPRAKTDFDDEYAFAQIGETELAWLADLTHVQRLDDDVLLCHGTPQSDHHYLLETITPQGARAATQAEIAPRLGDIPASTQLVACGHTHMPRVVHMESGLVLLNPGSVGRPAFHDDHVHFHVMETGSSHARYAIAEKVGADWRVELRSVAYDHESMAALAIKRGQLDWAFQLRHGRAQRRD